MSLFSFLRSKPLAELRGVERRTVRVVVASPDELTSPVTGLRAAGFHVALFERYHDEDRGRNERGAERLDPLGAVVYGETLLVTSEPEGLLVEVPLAAARFAFRGRAGNARLLDHVPPDLAPLAAKARGRGLVCYQESPLTQGDRFELSAMLEPPHGAQAGGYRTAPRATIVARGDLAPVDLTEILDVPPW